jgi:hypothetical protein
MKFGIPRSQEILILTLACRPDLQPKHGIARDPAGLAGQADLFWTMVTHGGFRRNSCGMGTLQNDPPWTAGGLSEGRI